MPAGYRWPVPNRVSVPPDAAFGIQCRLGLNLRAEGKKSKNSFVGLIFEPSLDAEVPTMSFGP